MHEKVHDLKERIKACKQLKKEINKLKKKGLSLNKFCAENGLAAPQVSRYVNLVNVPLWNTIKKIEKSVEKSLSAIDS